MTGPLTPPQDGLPQLVTFYICTDHDDRVFVEVRIDGAVARTIGPYAGGADHARQSVARMKSKLYALGAQPAKAS